jgi:hypothetical protein
MNKLIAITAGILLSSSALASNITEHRNARIVSANYETKAEAINAGFDIANELSTLTPYELRKELIVISNGFPSNLEIKQTEVQTEEFALVRGQSQYRAIVKVNYQYDTRDQD